MKLVIYTQYTENYGDEDQPYWKNKGGDTYVVENLTPAQIAKIKAQGIPTLTQLIEYSNSHATESIIGHRVVSDSTSVCAEWETPTKLSYVSGRWSAVKVTENTNEYGYMRREIERKIATWDMLPGNERENFNCTYVLRDGRVGKESDIVDMLEQA